jgi:hypothetical protein
MPEIHYGEQTMRTAEEYAADLERDDRALICKFRECQADSLRFAATHYVGAFSLNEAGIKLEMLADAIEHANDLGEFIKTPTSEADLHAHPQKVRAYVEKSTS